MIKPQKSNEVAVVDIGVSNIASVTNALIELGYEPVMLKDPRLILEFERLILPGNGSFRVAIERLVQIGWVGPIRSFAKSNKPILGICLGMQLMATVGEEDGNSDGLDLIPGISRKLNSQNLRLPHVGWNTVTLSRSHYIFEGIKPERDYYFCHSFVFEPRNSQDRLCHTNYGSAFTSVVSLDNVVGVQFHPEKSQKNGLRLLSNFMTWDGTAS